ncbi:MAG: CapA family protein [Oscillospiraceae bacterium]|jgi:poly-gamma-glutamate synthesis protein (capsule biosynthesis protein)|nr:CapA family protein [Oscillospiraceae bacterium]
MGAKRRRRSVSAGTWLVLALTLCTLGGGALALSRLAGGGEDARMDARLLLDALSNSVRLPELTAPEGAPEPIGQPVGQTPAPQTQAAYAATQATPSPTQAPRALTICAVGSLFGAKNIRQSGYDQESRTYLYDDIFADVRRMLTEADLALCVAETGFAGQEAGYSDYNTPDAMLDALRYAGIDMLSLASEHALNNGLDGLSATIRTIESKGLMVTGVDPAFDALGAAQVFQINDIQIAVLAYTYGISNAGQRNVKKADRGAIPILEEQRVREDIASARKAGADLVVVMPHWGKKNSQKIDSDQRKLAERLVAFGADIVLGAHPDVVQRVERQQAQRADGSTGEGLVAYSLGSFLTDVRDVSNAAGMVLRIRVEMDPTTRKVRVTDCDYVPTWVSRLRGQNGPDYQYHIYRADDAGASVVLDSVSLKSMDNALSFVRKTLADSAAKQAL